MLRENTRLYTVVMISVLILSSGTQAQDENHSFQSFNKSISPDALNQILGSHNAVQEKIVSDRLAEMVMKKFKTLSPEQRQRLADLSKDFGSQSNTFDFADKRQALEKLISNDPELRRAAEDLRSNFKNQNFDMDTTNSRAFQESLRKQVEDRLQDEIRRRSNAIDNNPATPFDFNNTPFSSEPNSGTPNSLDPTRPNTANSNRPDVNNPNSNRPPTNNSPNNNSSPDSRPPFPNDPSEPFQNPNNPSRNNTDPSFEIDPANSPHGGFSDSGQNPNLNNPIPPSQNSASGQNDSLPKESVGHRFNRIVMNSFEKAMEKKVGSDANGQPQSFERLMSKFVDSVSKSNPDFAANLNSGTDSFYKNITSSFRSVNNTTRMRMPRWNGLGGGGGGPSFGGGGGGFAMPNLDARSMATFLLVAGMIICAVVFALKKTALGEMLGVRPAPEKKPVPPSVPQTFKDYDEIVTLIDDFTLWLFGKKASWWNSKIVSDEVSQKSPQYSSEFQAVMDIYDQARYAEASQPVSSQMAEKIRTTLNQLKDASMLEKNPSAGLLNG